MVKSLSDLILERKSVKSYYKKSVSDEFIGELIDAARWAPSAGNMQDWRFIIVRSEKVKEKIAEACLNQDWMREAPVFIAICSDFQFLETMYPKLYSLFSVQDCALATANILLKATELGLGSCVVAPFNREKVREVLGVPDNADVYSIVILGYAREIEPSHRHNIQDLVFFEKWGQMDNQSVKRLKDVEVEIEKKIKNIKEKMLSKLPLKKK
ncbi:nitroreductase family protein [Candidatus Woesearchaeota archaeon]|nr:nitroreductase family protein [Candidatus Woesearchaeota archaeon]